jgi:hypothetical protein
MRLEAKAGSVVGMVRGHVHVSFTTGKDHVHFDLVCGTQSDAVTSARIARSLLLGRR